jgi:signal peptidase II
VKGISRHAWAAYVLAAAVILIDQASKIWIVERFRLEERGQVLLPGPMNLTMVWNTGVSFGLLGGDADVTRWALTVFALGVAAVLAYWVRKADKALFGSAIGLIIGGAIGNAIDRVRYGSVADFLDFSELMFPWVFNIADAAINIGIALLILDALVRRERAPQPR